MSQGRETSRGRDTLKHMKISADFAVVPDDFAKAAAPEYRVDGAPAISFPFYIDEVDSEARYLHWAFTDPDSIPVCGFAWIHWAACGISPDTTLIPENASHSGEIGRAHV